MGEVRLPGLVGHVGLEPDVGRGGSLLRFGGDGAVSGEDAPDRGPGDGQVVVVAQVPLQGVGAGVESVFGEFLA